MIDSDRRRKKRSMRITITGAPNSYVQPTRNPDSMHVNPAHIISFPMCILHHEWFKNFVSQRID